MRYEIYTIYDSAAKIFNQPFYARARGEAIRNFIELANDDNTTIGKHPEDYSLHFIGTFDDQNGDVEQLNSENLGLASSYVTTS